MQNWLLELRKQDKAVVLLHHDGKSGKQRGTGSKEDILDLVIQLEEPEGYSQDLGCRFILNFMKSRSAFGEAVRPRVVTFENNQWTHQPFVSEELSLVQDLQASGKTYRQIVEETGISLGKISKLLNSNK
jgi:hypothetical protein